MRRWAGGVCLVAVCGLVGAFLRGGAWLAQADEALAIQLRAATFCPTCGDTPSLAQGDPWAQATTGDGRQRWLVQFAGPIEDHWLAALLETGATPLGYVPDHAFQVAATTRQIEALRRLPGVAWMGPYLAAYTLAPELASGSPQLIRIDLDGAPSQALLDRLAALGVGAVGVEGRTLVLPAADLNLARLAGLPGVMWVSPLGQMAAQSDVAAQETRSTVAWATGLDGSGQIINLSDTGMDTGIDQPGVHGDIHRDVDNRLAHIASWPMSSVYYPWLMNPLDDDGAADLDSGHGTHVAGTAAGNGLRSAGRYKGVAHRATLTFQALEQYCRFSASGHAIGLQDGFVMAGIPANLQALYDQAYQWGARIHNNSWAMTNVGLGTYTSHSSQTDRFAWEHPDYTIVCAVGNAGQDANRDGLADYGTILPPATAKNVIAVGASENRRPNLLAQYPYGSYGQAFPDAFGTAPLSIDPMGDAGLAGLAAFSGRGPAADGRLRPDLVAPGTWVASLRSSRAGNPTSLEWLGTEPGEALGSYYLYLGGSSAAAPQVSGAAALVRQAYQNRGHAAPSAALIKATLIQSARDISGQYPAPFGEAGPIPNPDEGWGALDVSAAVAPGRSFVDETVALATGEQATYHYMTGVLTSPVKVTLVWTDYPAETDVAKALVNDLDLEVRAPDGTLYRGNSFSGGWSRTGGVADRFNNVECVYLPRSLGGDYTVIVRGANVPRGPQRFALLVDAPPFSPTAWIYLPLVLRAQQVAPTTATAPAATSMPVHATPSPLAASPTPSVTPSARPTATRMASPSPTSAPGG